LEIVDAIESEIEPSQIAEELYTFQASDVPLATCIKPPYSIEDFLCDDPFNHYTEVFRHSLGQKRIRENICNGVFLGKC